MNPFPPYIMIGSPCFGAQVNSIYAHSVLKLQKICYGRGDVGFNVLAQWGDALIQRARQDIVARFLANTPATHLLFVDADVGFEPEQVFRLLDLGVDVAAAVYPDKRLNLSRFEAMAKEGRLHLESAVLDYDFEVMDPEKIQTRDGFTKVRRVGMGFTLIRRAVFERMMKRYPELRYTGAFTMDDPLEKNPFRYAFFNCMIEPKTGIYLSEDHSFCRRWTDMGGEIWADLKSRLQHVGPLVFSGDLATQFQSSPSGQIENPGKT